MDKVTPGLAGYKRSLWPLLGLPFDAITMENAAMRVYRAIDQQERLFISTPNLNFVISSLKDAAFRQSVIHSDLSLADGMPLIWVAKMLSIPVKERVSGSGLIEYLLDNEQRRSNPVKVFFFGGEEGVAKQACDAVNQQASGLRAVGFYYPGFGTVEEMSQENIISQINRSGADFIIVSLGAKKGQAWIEHNRSRLQAPVISHLGAVVNFLAGTVNRAPVGWQRFGLEWLWRIKEEPNLWRRYFFDGIAFFRILITKVLPYALLIRRQQLQTGTNEQCVLTTLNEGDRNILKISGVIRNRDADQVRDKLSELSREAKLEIDLSSAEYFEPAFIGCLFLARKHWPSLKLLKLTSKLIKLFKYNNAEFLLE